MPDEDFVAVFREEYRSLVALGTALTGRFDVGEELAQESLLRAYRDWSSVSTYDRPGAWVRRAVHVCGCADAEADRLALVQHERMLAAAG